jgi:hypothetical protein
MRLQPIELQHMPLGLRRVYDEIATVWYGFFIWSHYVRTLLEAAFGA